jgi:hypothetical protein
LNETFDLRRAERDAERGCKLQDGLECTATLKAIEVTKERLNAAATE